MNKEVWISFKEEMSPLTKSNNAITRRVAKLLVFVVGAFLAPTKPARQAYKRMLRNWAWM